MLYVIAVDPGDAHVGWAAWCHSYGSGGDGMSVSRVGELHASDAVPFVDHTLERVQGRPARAVLVVEEFILYPDKERTQAWSPLRTSRMIGALEWVARTRGAEFVEQGANVKKATAAQLQARGIDRKGVGPHARDAELHLVHYLVKEGLWPSRSSS